MSRTCSYRRCSAALPEGATVRREYCGPTHRGAESDARRGDALRLFVEGSALRAANSQDTERMADIDRRVAKLLGH